MSQIPFIWPSIIMRFNIHHFSVASSSMVCSLKCFGLALDALVLDVICLDSGISRSDVSFSRNPPNSVPNEASEASASDRAAQNSLEPVGASRTGRPKTTR